MTARGLGLLAVLIVFSAALCFAAECGLRAGTPVTLASNPNDPDVIVWDSRERLVAYAAGRWNSAHDVMAHTKIAGPGTRARVIACFAGAAHLKLADIDRDAIGVRIMSGPLRGRYGWVVSSDVHMVKTAQLVQ